MICEVCLEPPAESFAPLTSLSRLMNMAPKTSFSNPSVRIVMIDDSPADAGLVQRSLKRMKVSHSFESFLSGSEAVTKLTTNPTKAAQPDLILLDLNMPGMSGHEVLTHLKSHQELSTVPVIVLSTSSSLEDVQKAYRERANAYVNKPSELQDFQMAIEKIYAFWCDAAILPE